MEEEQKPRKQGEWPGLKLMEWIQEMNERLEREVDDE